jgi:hypothetical protein
MICWINPISKVSRLQSWNLPSKSLVDSGMRFWEAFREWL